MTTHIEHQTSAPIETSKLESILTTKVARVIFGLPFVAFGLFHFAGADQMAAMVPVPGGVFWIYFTGVALVAGGLGIITGILGRWAAYGLAALMALFAVTVHLPNLGDPAMGQIAMVSLLKDTALLGASLAFAGLFRREGSSHREVRDEVG